MAIGFSILLIAAGAVLTWAINRTVSGVEVNTIGVILMIGGGLGLVASLLAFARAPWRREAVVESESAGEDPYAVQQWRR